MRTKKTVAISLASFLLASVMVLPTSAASSFTPTSKNFVPVFDFDNTPSTKYTDGYHPGDRHDTVGDGNGLQCMKATGAGSFYTLTIKKGAGIKGNALVENVLDIAPPDGSYDPIDLRCEFGDHKLPGISAGQTPTDVVFWVDWTGYKLVDNFAKGILFTIQETDYDSAGNALKTATAWTPKTKNEGGFYQVEDGNGGWKNEDMNANADQHDFYPPQGYKGWIKIPISNLELTWSSADQDGKFDGKQIQEIELGMGDYQRQAGSTLVYDEFGLMVSSGGSTTPTTKSSSSNGTTAKPGANTTAAAIVTNASGVTDSSSIDSEVSEDTQDTDVTNADTTIAATTTTKKTQSTEAVGPVSPNKNNGALAIIITIIVVVVLAGAGTGVFFFYKKIKKDGYSSFSDYFKNRKKIQ